MLRSVTARAWRVGRAREVTMRPIPFLEETTRADYEELGMMCGVEIHQQLLTARKLFCRCPAGRYSRHVDAEVLRHMRPTLSELGEYDGTALMEFKTRKEIIYQLNTETVCTYEMDDTPPFMVDDEALEIGLEITMLLGCNLVSEVHIARKQYLDGSIPTGFQRTAILGVDGRIEAAGQRIGIIQLGLEEDSCREVSDEGHVRKYRTDRLGMPLIEMVTYPDMHTPQEAAAAVESLRRLARSTGKVRTGHGATRQDVNVSVTGGTRCEIKGVPSIRMIPRLVHFEAFRQRGLLDLRDELLGRGLAPETFEATSADVTNLARRTQFLPLQAAIEAGAEVHAVRLPGFGGTLTWPLQPGIRFAKELSDRVRVVACLDQLPNIVHSDLPDETLSYRLWASIRGEVGAERDDAVVLVWGGARDVQTAVGEVELRAREALQGVPNETRQAFWDGTTGFERVLPGPDRMYPDTDLPPKELPADYLAEIRERVGEAPWIVDARLRETGIDAAQAWTIAIGPWAGCFERAVAGGLKARLAASVLAVVLPGLVRRGVDAAALTDARVDALLAALAAGEMLPGAVPRVVRTMAGQGLEPAAVIELMALRPLPVEERVHRVGEKLRGVDRGALRKDGEAAVRAVMGQVMRDLRGKVPGVTVREQVVAWLEHGVAGEEVGR